MMIENNKNKKPLLSISIPTYNRASFLYELLNNIMPQIQRLDGRVQVCISNNGSSDDTSKIVTKFISSYPNLIKYNENTKNLGYDKNFILVTQMADGEFVWLLCDDDKVVGDGIDKVFNFIKNYCNEQIGLAFMGHESYYIDEQTKNKIVYFNTIEKNQPKVHKINFKNIIGLRSDNSFGSVLLFNNVVLKKVFNEYQALIEKGVGSQYIHTFLYQLMFLKYKDLEILKFNEKIIDVDLHYYKYYVEDIFELYYVARKKFSDLLLLCGDMESEYRKIIMSKDKKILKNAIKEIVCLKAFNVFNYFSFLGCFKLFFSKAKFIDALIIFLFFIILHVVPTSIIKYFYKLFIDLKYKKESKLIWENILVVYTKMSRGHRRLIC